MARILIVDDSNVDQKIAGGLLQGNNNWTLAFASNGAEALQLLQQQTFNLVLTDLQMPEVSGLDLVRRMREDFRHTPVILMTSHGSEEIAVEALQLGAASYVPKTLLSQSLADTVETVLAVAESHQDNARVLGHLVSSQLKFETGNDPELLHPVAIRIRDLALQAGSLMPADTAQLVVAVEEALNNALYRGNLELPAELRDTSPAEYQELFRQRIDTPPYCDRRIFVDVQCTPQAVTVDIADQGPGFDPASVSLPAQGELDRRSGRGLVLMNSLMDEVSFSGQGNKIRLVKRVH